MRLSTDGLHHLARRPQLFRRGGRVPGEVDAQGSVAYGQCIGSGRPAASPAERYRRAFVRLDIEPVEPSNSHRHRIPTRVEAVSRHPKYKLGLSGLAAIHYDAMHPPIRSSNRTPRLAHPGSFRVGPIVGAPAQRNRLSMRRSRSRWSARHCPQRLSWRPRPSSYRPGMCRRWFGWRKPPAPRWWPPATRISICTTSYQ